MLLSKILNYQLLAPFNLIKEYFVSSVKYCQVTVRN